MAIGPDQTRDYATETEAILDSILYWEIHTGQDILVMFRLSDLPQSDHIPSTLRTIHVVKLSAINLARYMVRLPTLDILTYYGQPGKSFEIIRRYSTDKGWADVSLNLTSRYDPEKLVLRPTSMEFLFSTTSKSSPYLPT